MKEKFIEFQHEGDTLEAYLAVDSNQSKKLPAVMISHTWRGRSDFECDKARALAALQEIRPNFAGSLRADLERWFEPEHAEHLFEGLKKAGMQVQ